MAVLDGKYEILSERSLEEGQSFFSATAPDGQALHIVWFDLSSPQQEVRFESYRQLLRTLKREGKAALHDIVSRPGAHYVAWRTPNHQPSAPPDPKLAELLQSYGYQPAQADIRFDPPGKAVVYGLAFGGAHLPLEPRPDAPTAPTPSPSRPRLSRLPDWALAWLLGGALGLLALGLFALAFQRSAAPLVLVPELLGAEVNRATQALYEARLEVSLQASPAEAPPFTVTELAPPPGVLLRQGQEVRLSYAAPPGQLGMTETPQLRGLSVSNEVQARLEAAGLRLGDALYIYANTPEDVIIAQAYPAGSQVEENAPVEVLVSLGPLPEETFLPDLTGMSYEDALFWAQLADLEVAPPVYESASGFAPGSVVSQSIPPNTLVAVREANLELTLAEAGSTAETPLASSLIGLSESEARQVASEAGYPFSAEWIEDLTESLNLPEGVVSQTPAPGEPAENGVNVLVNVHPVSIPRPEVTAALREPEERRLEYLFQIEPGIPRRVARVTATTLSGNEYPVETGTTVEGGDRVQGSWRTLEPGPVTFTLYLGNAVYQGQTRND